MLIKTKTVNWQVRGKIHRKMLFRLRWRKQAHFLVVIDIQKFVPLRSFIHLFIREACRKKLSKIIFCRRKTMQLNICNVKAFCFFSMHLMYFCANFLHLSEHFKNVLSCKTFVCGLYLNYAWLCQFMAGKSNYRDKIRRILDSKEEHSTNRCCIRILLI